MSKELIFLGIESSCDETAASIVKEDKKGNVTILSNIVSSQVEEHKPFGGVVPELAARSHVEKIDTIIKKAVQKSGVVLENITGVAATAGPGLACLFNGWNECGKNDCNFFKETIFSN